jgi:hypothetical protein
MCAATETAERPVLPALACFRLHPRAREIRTASQRTCSESSSSSRPYAIGHIRPRYHIIESRGGSIRQRNLPSTLVAVHSSNH